MTTTEPTQPGEPATDEPAADGRGRASRTVVVTFLGAVVRRLGGWMPIAGAVELLAPLGIDGPSVRTAVFRLKKRGWLDPETRHGSRGYALTPVALAALAAGDEVIWHARQPAALEDGWCIVNFSIPESMRSKRQQLRAHLSALGFGNVGTAMWIAPARMRPAAESAIEELGLTRHSAVFVGDHVAGQDLESLLYESWDLTAIDERYRAFIAEFGQVADALDADGEVEAERAFTTYLSLVDRWRRLPYRDPGLPRELLAADWSGPEATALFERLVATLESRALAYAGRHWPAS
ncbi:PaaX family transcriptional regulator C-terminal domain-containing protein [Nocardioides panacihumi]|uniref:PaaX family transcriptional regulator C-terminal domain-containing protein n=1 Tax=Nocardioides panacihumi TaxID=400774 RepID=A0ABN2RST2_9ACTN